MHNKAIDRGKIDPVVTIGAHPCKVSTDKLVLFGLELRGGCWRRGKWLKRFWKSRLDIHSFPQLVAFDFWSMYVVLAGVYTKKSSNVMLVQNPMFFW